MIVLGIESSCDETSVSLLDGEKVLVNLISSQDFHALYGGVVPELSSRAHLQRIIPLLKEALKKVSLQLKDVDLICATAGPGLIGALIVGLTFAKGLAFSLKKPFIAVNHIEGHIYSGFLMDDKPEFPFLVLVVSGGHSLLLLVKNFTEIIQLGTTLDDAAGEAFDKVSKMLGFGYPGGPKIQKHAEEGNGNKIEFPVANVDLYNFSFSGLKTSVLRYIQKNYNEKEIPGIDKNNIAASFQEAVLKPLIINTEAAIKDLKVNSICLVGGVAANKNLRNLFLDVGKKYNKKVVIPKFEYCGDNAAMIAYRGLKIFENGISHSLNFSPFPGLKENQFSKLS
jgi:tRNA N6-adenosine threonylcarbamoyltransferase